MLPGRMTCDVPIQWSPVKSDRDEAYHARINSLVQKTIQTHQSRRLPQQDQQGDQEPEEVEEEPVQDTFRLTVRETVTSQEPPQIEGVTLPTEEDFDKHYTPGTTFPLWQGGENNKRRAKNLTDKDIMLDMILHSDSQISEKLDNPAVKKAFVTFLKGVKKEVKKRITYADVLASKKSAHFKKKRILNAKLQELRAMEERKFKLMSKIEKLEKKRKKTS